VSTVERSMCIPVLDAKLRAEFIVPDEACGLVAMTHASRSDLSSPLSRMAERELHGARIGTVLVNLLTQGEENEDEVTGQLRLNVKRLAHRIVAMTDWLLERTDLGVGLAGTDTCAAAALIAAASRPREVRAVVSLGGRPDLADDFLRSAYQPTLLIMGTDDGYVADSNRKASTQLPGVTRLEVVAGSIRRPYDTKSLLEPVRLATDWFIEYLTLNDSSRQRQNAGADRPHVSVPQRLDAT
jgi:putative phosphoribosyl transferase